MAENTLTYTRDDLKKFGIQDLRRILRSSNGTPSNKLKGELIDEILRIQSGAPATSRSKRGRPASYVPEGKIEEEKPAANVEEPAEGSSDKRHGAEHPEEEHPADGSAENPAHAFYPGNAEYGGMKRGFFARAQVEDRSAPVSGVLELHSEGYGFLRAKNYEASATGDTFVSRQAVKANWLRRGDYVVGYAERTRETGSSSLTELLSVNGMPPKTPRRNFDELVPCYPDERITLEHEKDDLTLRIMDILCPLGKGQRGLIVAPPKTGKTTLLKRVAQAIGANHPDIHLIVLLIDERPEEVTDLTRSVKGEVVFSTFDEPAEHHIRAAELVMWRAKRLVELGRDVVILLDSITRLTRAYNQALPASGKILSGGIDPIALQAPKKFFGGARNIENGGSLTVLATALVETGSKMDDVIYEEFKGTGNMEIHLTRELAERRIFPAIDLYGSGTRKDELLLSPKELECAYLVRRFLKNDDGVERLLDMLARTETNDEFVSKVPTWLKLINM